MPHILGGFTKTKHFKPSDIDDLFVERNHGILYPHWPNGPGGWIWKPYCILKYMLYVANEGDLVCYCDSRYIFTHSVIDKVQKLVESAPHIAISLHKPNEGRYKERWYSKGDAFTILNADTPENRESLQAWAGFSCYKVSFFSIQFVSQWLAYVQDIRVLYGAATITPNDAEFKDSRQDQSVLSLLAKKWKVTFFEWDSGDGLLNCRAGDCTH